MSRNTPIYRPERTRVTMPLSRPHRKVQASLSFNAALCLDWASAAIHRAGIQRPQHSSVIRRALELYAQFLDGMDRPQLSSEACQILASSKAINPDREDQEAIYSSFKALQATHPLPSLSEVRHGPLGGSMDVIALDARVDEMVRQIYRARFARREAPV